MRKQHQIRIDSQIVVAQAMELGGKVLARFTGKTGSLQTSETRDLQNTMAVELNNEIVNRGTQDA